MKRFHERKKQLAKIRYMLYRRNEAELFKMAEDFIEGLVANIPPFFSYDFVPVNSTFINSVADCSNLVPNIRKKN